MKIKPATTPPIKNTNSRVKKWLSRLWLVVLIAYHFLFSVSVRAVSCDPPPSGVISWWTGDGTAADFAGINNATLQGGATDSASGLVGQMFTFDGATGYAQIPDAATLRPAIFTLEAWVRFTSLNSTGSGNSPAGDQYIVFKQNTRSTDFEGINLSKTRISGGDVFAFQVTSASGATMQVNSITTISTGVWYHVAAVRGSNYIQIFVNGQMERQATVTFAQDYGTLPLYFGTSGQSYWDHKFAGNLDEVTLYNRPLSSSEIAAIYAAGAAGKCETPTPASITGQPQNQSVTAGNNATFTVTASGTSPLVYQWQFNGAAVTNATNATLNLPNVQSSQAGNYRVIVMNPLASVTSSVAVLTVLPVGTITIDGSTKFQVIDGFGVNANSRSWTNAELKPVLDAYIDQAGATLFHAIIQNSNWEGTNDNSDPNVMNWAYYNTIYNSGDFQRLWGMMAYLNQRGVTNGVIPKIGGPVSLWMGGEQLKAGFENEFAETVASMLIYARSNQHLHFSLVRAVNEPDITVSGVYMSSPTQYVTTMHDIAKQLETNGMADVRFSGPDLANTSTSWISAMMGDSYLMSKIAHIGIHSYQTETSDATGISNFIKQSAYPNLHFWMTEYNVWCQACQNGTSGDNTWNYARNSAAYLLTLLSEGASAGVVFEAYDSPYYNYNDATGANAGLQWSFWGLFSVDNPIAAVKTYTPRKGFYTFSQISKFVMPGAQRINMSGAATPLQMLAFYNTNNGQFTITGVNSNSSTATLSCALSSLPSIPILDFYYTSTATNLSHSMVSVTNNSFITTIPADCVFTLTASNTISPFLALSMQNGSASLTLRVGTGSTYQIQTSTNLANWGVVTNVTLPNGGAQIINAGTNNNSACFYRAVFLH